MSPSTNLILRKLAIRLYLFEDGVGGGDRLNSDYWTGVTPPQGQVADRKLDTATLDLLPERLNAEFYFRRSLSKATWQELICAAVKDQERDGLRQKLLSLNTGAVLFLRVCGREWAITFGSGRYFINESRIVRDFGVKVVLNRVQPESIRTVDFNTFFGEAKLTKQQVTRGQKISYYDLELTENVLKNLAGLTTETYKPLLGTAVAGGESLLITTTLDLTNPERLFREIITAYESDSYKTEEERKDLSNVSQNLYQIKDQAEIDRLDEMLVNDLKNRIFSEIQIAYPGMVVWGNAWSGLAADEPRESVDLENVRDGLRDDFGVAALKRRKIFIFDEDGHITAQWPLYKSLAYAVVEPPTVYTLMFGRWYRVAELLVERLKDFLRSLAETQITFPPSSLDEDESVYARRICGATKTGKKWTSGKEMLCLDQRGIAPSKSTRRYEACDILIPRLSGSRTVLVHIKKTSGAADDDVPSHEKFSHLFVQGLNSAETLISDKKYQSEVRTKVRSWRPDVDEAKGSIKATSIKIVYLVGMTGDYVEKLPAFSLLTLRSCVVKLRRLGFEVSVYPLTVA